MKVSIRLLLSFSLLAPIFAHTQAIPQGTFQHIIIVVQENRTPDNLFGSAPSVGATCGSPDPFEAGVDIDNGGWGTPPNGVRRKSAISRYR
jgi:phospholipase C